MRKLELGNKCRTKLSDEYFEGMLVLDLCFVLFSSLRNNSSQIVYRFEKAISNSKSGKISKLARLCAPEPIADAAIDGFPVTHVELPKFKREKLDYPPYSLYMSPCDFHVFGQVDNCLKGKRFNSDDELKDAGKDWVSSWPQEFWRQGILRLDNQWDRCVQSCGV
ncbi:histone-lysine N-methyltransferase SETMAR [Trichonephila clavipes]|nr:histone-lysine N-methyltransferase SETMAR [Trichonephila clavipes]